MSEQATDRSIWSGIDVPKTIAGVLAAVSAAVVGSFLGVAGTLAGAAIASVVGSVGTEIYHRWINRSATKIKSTFVTAPAAVGTPEVAAAADESPSEEPGPRRTMRWGRVAAVAAAVFVLAMGALTTFELVTGKSAADAVGNSSSQKTTVGSLFGGGSTKSDDSDTPAVSPSATPTGVSPSDGGGSGDGGATAGTSASPSPSATAPTTGPATATTAPTGTDTTPAEAPTTDNQQNTTQDEQNTQPQPQGTE